MTDINYSANNSPAPCGDGSCAGGGRGWGRGFLSRAIQNKRFSQLESRIPHPASRIFSAFALALAFAFCIGCHVEPLDDPNDVATAGAKTPDVIMKQLNAASDSLNLRKARQEINDRQFRRMMSGIAKDYIAEAKDTTITDGNASTWGKVYVSARDWKSAEAALQHSVGIEKEPAKADFQHLGVWIGDSLSLASAQAHLGKVPEAIATTRSLFEVPPKAKVPILTSILYDVVPPAFRKGHDMELAELLKDGIKQHEAVIVDPSTDGGRDFLLARPHHIRRAWEEIALLYASVGRRDLAQEALDEAHRVR